MDDGLVMHWMSLEDVFNKTISYAQNYEDILLSRVFPQSEGFFIDVGANHPVFHSVTKLFYDRGWHGINIEPSPAVFEHLITNRPRDINLNVGVSDQEGSLTFFESLAHHGWSTFRAELAAHYQSQGIVMTDQPIPVTTLARVCGKYVDGPIDFLKIDAEGFEREVLLGADFHQWRPRVILIENSWPEAWESILETLDYRQVAFDGLNRFYVPREDESLLPLFKSSVNVLDNFVPYEMIRLFRGLAAERDALASALESAPGPLSGPRVLAKRIRSAVRRHLSQRAG